LEELQGVPLEKRKARFLTAVAVVDPDSQVEIVEGVLEGQITESPRGTEGFGYDPVFEVPELHKTLAELALDQKNQISHRACALNKAKDLLKQKLNQQENVGA
jgi:XTP/dITP diphosphohydrolase